METYMRPTELSKHLKIGLSTVWYLVKKGELKPIKITPRVTVFAMSDINNFINKSNNNVNTEK